MTIEVANYIDELNIAYPGVDDDVEDGDDHLRLIKTVLKQTLGALSGQVYTTDVQMNYLRYVDTSNVPVLATNVAGFSVGPFASTHLALGGGQIQAKNANTATTLELNKLGGSVNIGPQAGTGNVNFYHNASRAVFSETSGIGVRDTTGTLPALNLYSNSDALMGQLIHSTALYLQNVINSSGFVVTGRDGAGATKILFSANPLSGGILYYNGITAFQTTNIGGRITPFSGANPYLEFFRADLVTRNGYLGFASSGVELRQEVVDQSTVLSGVITGGTVRSLLVANPTAGVSLYYAGVLRFATTTNGVLISLGSDVSPDASANGYAQFVGNGYSGYLTLDGTGLYLGHNSVSRKLALRVGGKNGLVINPESSLEGYFNTTLAFETANESIYGSALRARHGSGVLLPVGYNGFAVSSPSSSTALRKVNVGSWFRTSTNITLDTTTDEAVDGSAWTVENISGATIQIAPTAVTLIRLDGATGAAGTQNLAPYGCATIMKASNGNYRILGSGLSS